ncbi:MAG TPA: DegT/DnrJ/EryC1/StrS family aminotransferase [Prolixibacteraceae bacterium]|nr:DegT/DnrJ/EryC1/StrS family aminotransferase [Prolixibacteraceae bacterium]
MKRFTDLEKKYVLEAVENEFSTSKNSIFNNRMEQKFCELFNAKYAIGHVNGTQTMHTALVALGIKAGEEVIVPPLTMSSTALAVLQNNSIPVFADVDLATFNIDPESVKKCITEKTRAIISVSLYGLSPDYDKLLEICIEHNLYLIEDNAECFLGTYKGKLVGQFGDFSSFSFQASKHITCGEGGMLTTDNEEFANNARRFSSLGYAGVSAKQGKITRNDIQDPNYSRHVSLGFNYRMSEVNAAVVLGQLERAEELVDQRVKVAKIFDQAIEGTNLLTRQAEPEGYNNSYWAYSAALNTDNPKVDWYRFRDLFQKNGGDGFYAAWKLSYNEPLFKNEIQNGDGVWQKYNEKLCPVSEYLQPRMIQLKTNYWDLSEAESQAEILNKTIKMF